MLKLSLAVVPALLFCVQSVSAQEPVAAESQATSWLNSPNSQGLVTNLPVLPRSELKARLAALQAQLSQQKAQLAVGEEEARFDAKDAVITLVMPGGLVYAAFRKQQHFQSAREFAQISEQLDALHSDLVAFRVIADDRMLASAAP